MIEKREWTSIRHVDAANKTSIFSMETQYNSNCKQWVRFPVTSIRSVLLNISDTIVSEPCFLTYNIKQIDTHTENPIVILVSPVLTEVITNSIFV